MPDKSFDAGLPQIMRDPKSGNRIYGAILRPGAFQVLIGLAVLGFLVYGNAIFHPFVHDDVVFVLHNPNIARWDNIGEAFLMPGVPFQSLRITTPYYRPVLEILYRAQHAVFGMNPAGFHFFNIILHILASWLVFLAVRFWGFRRPWAAWVAVFFLVHPVQSEAVACVSGISNLAVAVLLLWSFVLYAKSKMARGRGGKFDLALSGLIFIGALLTKEQAVLLPFVLAAYEIASRRKGTAFPAAGRLLVFFVLTAAYFFWRGHLFPGHVSSAFENRPELFLRLMAIPRIIMMYLGLIVFPWGLHYYRSVDIMQPPGWAWGLLTALAGLGWSLFVWSPPRLKRPVVIGFSWGFVFLLPALNIVPLINEFSFILTAEHFLYLSLAGFLAGGSALAFPWIQRLKSDTILALLLVGAVVFSGQTAWQNAFWRGEIPLFERASRFEPGLGRVRLLLARAYLEEKRYSEAMEEFAKGLSIMEDYVRRTHHPKARVAYQQFIKGVYRDRGQVYMALGDLPRSSEEFRASIAVKIENLEFKDTGIDDSQTANNLAMNLLRMGKREEARRWWEVAVRMEPGNAEALNNLGMLALERKDRRAAIFFFQRSLRAAPGFPPAEQNLIRARQL